MSPKWDFSVDPSANIPSIEFLRLKSATYTGTSQPRKNKKTMRNDEIFISL